MEGVSFDYFKKLDIRVGEIKEAEKIEGTDKLLVLKVDLGSERRQLVAGIAETYSKEDLIGKRVVVLTNIEPKILKGKKSEGMLLAADANGKPYLLSVDSKVPLGSMVR